MTTTSELHPGTADRVVAAAEAALALVPAGAPLALDVARPAADVDAAAWSAGAVAALNAGGSDASVAVLVGADLVQALATAPGGALDLGAALQPALDAAAAALGCAAGAGRSLDAGEVAALLTADAVAVPLHAGGVPTAVVVARTSTAAPTVRGLDQVGPSGRGVELLHGVAMEVTVELGRTRLSVRDLLALTPGDVVELDRAAGSPADLLVNGRLIARGEVVVLDENFALRVTEIVAQSPTA
ncbi:MAG TPA: flagellar motor switch protein FliN [Nocardioides sp.]|nr:flagellar motor switch protein FliN [uncultured Nocardioides sp.]HEX5986846.1 flagellar motor switch protein FliN [Nocardioides sp.]